MIRTIKPAEEEKRYQIKPDKDVVNFHVIEKVGEEDRKIATFYGHEAFKVSSTKSAPQRMAEKCAREMNYAWNQIKHLFPRPPKKKQKKKKVE